MSIIASVVLAFLGAEPGLPPLPRVAPPPVARPARPAVLPGPRPAVPRLAPCGHYQRCGRAHR